LTAASLRRLVRVGVCLQFSGAMGDRLKSAYGEFCARHNEAVQLYKDLLKSDVNFQTFIKVIV